MGITRKAWGPSQKSGKYMLPARKRRVEFEKERSSWVERTWEVKQRGQETDDIRKARQSERGGKLVAPATLSLLVPFLESEKDGDAVFFLDMLSLRSPCDIQVEMSSGHLLHEAGSGRNVNAKR